MKVRRSFWVLAAVCALLAAGCGGEGGGDHGGPFHPSTTLATETPGTTWTYALSGTATPTGGGSSEIVSGTAQATVTSTTFNAQPVLAISLDSSISLNGGSVNHLIITYYVQQDVNGNIIEYGSSRTDSSGTTTLTVSNPSLANSELYPGTFSQGETINTNPSFTNNTSETYEFQIVQASQVNTQDGSYATWEATASIDGNPLGTQYWDPAIGSFVKGTFLGQGELGATTYNLTINYNLTSYTPG